MGEDQVQAAMAALEAHDALVAAGDAEPRCDGEGTPIDPADWLRWHTDRYRPAFSAWSAAMAALERACRQPVGRHPATFRPLCEEIIEADSFRGGLGGVGYAAEEA
jgi:hypothetical protein